jgi:hypothetical protein
MSTGATAGGAAAAGAAAAAAARRRQQEEEENMTAYSKDDLEGWEFKIVRANTSKFKNHQAVQELCAEEAKAGWEMVEKFDDQRIRFKRRVEKRSGDMHLDIDPYRTQVGMSEGKIVSVVLGIVALLAGAALLIVLLARG